MKHIAIVLAGGTGCRMGAAVPKQFLPLAGRSVVEYAVDTFDAHPAISEVAVVVHPDWRGEMDAIAGRNRWTKLSKILDGGTERYLSSVNAIMTYIDCDDDTNLLFHDAARPLLPTAVVDRVVAALELHDAVGVGVPSSDTVWEVRTTIEDDGIAQFVARIPERRTMWLAQTPQAFRLPLIRDAYQRALQDPTFAATDDCGVVRRYMPEARIHIVEGAAVNFKLTTPDDLWRAENEIEEHVHRQ